METSSVSGLEMSWEKVKAPRCGGSGSDEGIHGSSGGRVIGVSARKETKKCIIKLLLKEIKLISGSSDWLMAKYPVCKIALGGCTG